jgi:hypothetical protein
VSVTAAQMAQAIGAGLQAPMVQAAAQLGQRIRAEEGGATAVRALAEWGLLPTASGPAAQAAGAKETPARLHAVEALEA